jgi:hypothetical protein
LRVPKNLDRSDLVIGISALSLRPLRFTHRQSIPAFCRNGKFQAYLHRRCEPSWAAAKPDALGWADDLTAVVRRYERSGGGNEYARASDRDDGHHP